MIRFEPVLSGNEPQDKKLITIQAKTGKETREYSTDISIDPTQWNQELKVVETSCPDFLHFNLRIQQLIKKMEGFQTEAILSGESFSLDDLDEKMKQMLSPVLVEFMESSIESDSLSRQSTKKAWWDTLNKLKVFNSGIRVNKVDYDFIERFDQWLRNKSLSQNTIHKHHKHLKKFLNLAIRRKYMSRNKYPYSEFKVALEKVERPALSRGELERLEIIDRRELPDQTYGDVLDMFLLSCYTGLRISDILQLGREHIEMTSKGIRIDIRTKKVGKMARLPLYLLFKERGTNTKPEQIILRHKKEKKRLFPGYTERMVSHRLSRIGRFCEMNKHITFHMGRHTFGTTMAMKVPLPVLQRLMQHSDIKTTMVYVNMNMELIDESLEQVEW